MDKNRGIGLNNHLPWSLPYDLDYFKHITLGHPIIMGRKTFKSFKRPLQGRNHWVLSQSLPPQDNPLVTIFSEFEEVLRKAQEHKGLVFVIGGAQLYKQFMPYTEFFYLTEIDAEFKVDTYFPSFSADIACKHKRLGPKNEQNPYDYSFVIYQQTQK